MSPGRHECTQGHWTYLDLSFTASPTLASSRRTSVLVPWARSWSRIAPEKKPLRTLPFGSKATVPGAAAKAIKLVNLLRRLRDSQQAGDKTVGR